MGSGASSSWHHHGHTDRAAARRVLSPRCLSSKASSSCGRRTRERMAFEGGQRVGTPHESRPGWNTCSGGSGGGLQCNETGSGGRQAHCRHLVCDGGLLSVRPVLLLAVLDLNKGSRGEVSRGEVSRGEVSCDTAALLRARELMACSQPLGYSLPSPARVKLTGRGLLSRPCARPWPRWTGSRSRSRSRGRQCTQSGTEPPARARPSSHGRPPTCGT